MSSNESSENFNPASEIFAELGEQTPTRLNEQVSWNLPLQKLRSYIIQSDDFGLPRFGVLSILARRTPFHLYDHKALVALCDTAFTDGVQIFINTEFFKSLINTPHIERIDKTIEQLQLERAREVQLLEDIAQQKQALSTEIRLVTALKDE